MKKLCFYSFVLLYLLLIAKNNGLVALWQTPAVYTVHAATTTPKNPTETQLSSSVPTSTPPTTHLASTTPPSAPQSQIKAYVQKQAISYGINPDLASCIVSHESQWVPDKLGPEKSGFVSQGLWQIYSKAWPSIPRAQTFDYKWSTDWALTQIANGHIEWWGTYDLYCSSTPIFI
jgi:hypothetical protein